jgi:hypothetical protein
MRYVIMEVRSSSFVQIVTDRQCSDLQDNWFDNWGWISFYLLNYVYCPYIKSCREKHVQLRIHKITLLYIKNVFGSIISEVVHHTSSQFFYQNFCILSNPKTSFVNNILSFFCILTCIYVSSKQNLMYE